MGLESIFKLSVVMNMIDNLSSPLAGVTSKVDGSVGKIEKLQQGFGGMAKTGAVMAGVGAQITSAVLDPVQATFETKKALGELSSIGVKDLGLLEDAAKKFSDTWAGTTKPDFITAAYDIKSGISSLNDEGVAEYTKLAGITAKGTKSTIGEMTSLFATGYGIYKDYYKDLSDIEFGEIFSAGIAKSVQQFKTTGSGMSEAIKTLGASATTSNVPLEEQFSILGMLQATMSGSEAGTKYKAFLKSAVKGGEELGLSFVDANNQMLSMPEILEKLKGKFGETMDAAEKVEIQKAFGDAEAVALIDLLYNKTGNLQDNIVSLHDEMGQGIDKATGMANAINNTPSEQYIVLKQRLQNVKESIGNSLLPIISELITKGTGVVEKAGEWIESHQGIVKAVMLVLLVLGGFLMIAGTVITVIGGVGIVFTKTVGFVKGFAGIVKGVPSLLDTMKIKAMYAGDGVKLAFVKMKIGASNAIAGIKNVSTSVLSFAKTATINGVTAVKSFVIGMLGMAKQAITTAVTALPGLIAGVWSFTAALLANPITWIVIAIIALIVALIALWMNWDKVSAFVTNVWNSAMGAVTNAFQKVKTKFTAIMNTIKITVSNGVKGVVTFFKTLPSKVISAITSLPAKAKAVFNNMVSGAKNVISAAIGWFKNSGKKIMDTFTEGIKAAINKPVEAVKGGLAKIRKMLPFSDAKEGPLSTLTLSGRRVLETITTGIHQREDMPARAVGDSFKKVDLTTTKKAIAKVNLKGNAEQDKKSERDSSTGKDKNIIIQKLLLNVDFSKLKDLKQLLKLISEIEEYTNGNNELTNDMPTPEPV